MLEARVAGGRGAKFLGQGGPLRAGAPHPDDAVEEHTVVAARATGLLVARIQVHGYVR